MNMKYTIKLVALCTVTLSVSAETIQMTFDSGVSRERIESRDCIQYGEPVFTSDAKLTYYTQDESFGPGMSAELNVPEGKSGFGNLGGIVNFSSCFKNSNGKVLKGQEIWVRARLKFPLGFEFNRNGRNKFLRLRTFHDEAGRAVSEGYNDLYINAPPGNSPGESQPFHYIFEGAQQWYPMGKPEDFFDLGSWNTIEYYIKLDNVKGSQGGSSMIRVWVDGKLIGETNDRNTLKQPDSYISSLYFFTYWDNAGAHKDQTFWVDDLTITTDTPSEKDTQGNPMIGVGVKPKSPTLDN